MTKGAGLTAALWRRQMGYVWMMGCILAVLCADAAARADNVSISADFRDTLAGYIGPQPKPSADPLCQLDWRGGGSSDEPARGGGGGGNCTNEQLLEASRFRNITAAAVANATEEAVKGAAGGGGGEKREEEATQQPPIVTFDEWTKEKLKQPPVVVPPVAAAPASGSPQAPPTRTTPPAAAARNYASKECGAKVIYSNPEAENTKAVLNDKEMDEYMRNPCEKAPHKQIVVELCETIQPRVIELGNFELFSSGPKDVKVWVSERFPSNEWTLLASPSAADKRHVQTFPVDADKRGVYAKFVKLELLSHHGSEHYCTLSLLRVLGMSMVDEYEAEAEAAAIGRLNVVSPPSAVPPASSDPLAQPPPPSSTQVVEEGGVEVGGAGGAGGAGEGAQQGAPVQKEEMPITTTPTPTEPTPASAIPKIVDEVVSGRIIKKIMGVVAEKLGGKEQEKSGERRRRRRGFRLGQCAQCPVGNSTPVHSHWCRVLERRARKKEERTPPSPCVSLSMRRRSSSGVQYLKMRRRRASYLQREAIRRHRDSVSLPDVIVAQPAPAKEEARQEKVAVVEKEQDMPPIEATPTESTPTEVPPTTTTTPQPPPPPSQQQPMPVPEGLPAGATSHKESVFMKLNKRIAALELNMSLSSEYLSQLSKQYVAQTDEQQRQQAESKRVAREAVREAAKEVEGKYTEELHQLRGEISQLSAWMHTVRGAGELARMKPVEESSCEDDDDDVEDAAIQPAAFASHQDGFWTTEQVVYVVVSAQVATLLLAFVLQSCIAYMKTRRRPAAIASSDVEKLVEEKIRLAMERLREEQEREQPVKEEEEERRRRRQEDAVSVTSTTSSALSVPAHSRKEKRRRRRAERREEERLREQRDSAMDSLPSPSEASELETPPTPAPPSVKREKKEV